MTYGQRRANCQGTAVPLTDGETREIAMQLPRGGVITGMVLDERGEPAVNAFVRAMRFMMMGGRAAAAAVRRDTTDDRGIYRIHSLQPGDYAVCATSAQHRDRRTTRNEFRWRSIWCAATMATAPSAGARQQMARLAWPICRRSCRRRVSRSTGTRRSVSPVRHPRRRRPFRSLPAKRRAGSTCS